MLQNQETGCSVQSVNFNLHNRSHLLRAAQEGIVFSFRYGIDIMKGMGMDVRKIHAGHANMFLSPLFRDTLAGVTGATIELYDTDGSVGAAKEPEWVQASTATTWKLLPLSTNWLSSNRRLPTKRHTTTHTHVGKNVSKNQQTIKYNNSLTYKKRYYGNKEYFPGIGKIKFEGVESKNPMAFRYYDAEKSSWANR